MDRIPAIRRAIVADVAPVVRALWAIAAVAAPTALRWAIDRGDSGSPFVTYYPGIALAALFLGWRWGAVVAVASLVVANGLFSEQTLWQVVTGPGVWVFVLFLLSCAILVLTGGMCRRLLRELEAAKAREELLNHELMHRVKNMLATVNAMAVLTARHAEPGKFAEAFTGRMKALDRATELLGTGKTVNCNVEKLVDSATEPFRTDGNFAIEGQAVELPRDACVPLALALHELCTNAAKHGALTAAEGKVSLTWHCAADGVLTLVWRESGGPPVPEAPRRTGMGTQLLRRQRGLSSVEIEFRPEGLACTITVEGCEPV